MVTLKDRIRKTFPKVFISRKSVEDTMSVRKTSNSFFEGIRAKLRRLSSINRDQENAYKSSLSHHKEEFHQKYDANSKSMVMSIDDFDWLKTVGTGSFGRVGVTVHRNTRVVHAVKILSKERVVKTNQVEHTINEKRILNSIDFPFIVKLEHHFMDNANLYMAMEYCCGGELFTLLRSRRRFTEKMSSFYAAQVVMVLEFLHSVDVLYRDLKPENILLDHRGYIKVADFGFAKRATRHTYTLCGTPDYLAPEMIMNKGYGKSVDWWSLGVLIYEMVAGYAPFAAEESMERFENIVSGRLWVPGNFSEELNDLVRRLLRVDVTHRCGCSRNGATEVKNQPWFNGTDWAALYYRKVEAPYIPNMTSETDSCNFDHYEEDQLERSEEVLYGDEFSDF